LGMDGAENISERQTPDGNVTTFIAEMQIGRRNKMTKIINPIEEICENAGMTPFDFLAEFYEWLNASPISYKDAIELCAFLAKQHSPLPWQEESVVSFFEV